MKYYRINPLQAWKLNLMVLSYMIAYIPAAIVATYAINRKGLKFSLTVGCMLNFLCGWVRFAGFKSGQEYFYWISFVGQCLGAIAQPFITNAITSMASNWFGQKERTIATTIGAFANILGGGIAFGIAPPIAVINSPNGKDISEIGMVVLLASQAGFASLLLLAVVSIFRDKPPTPPTVLEVQPEQSIWETSKKLIKNPAFLILFVAFSVGAAVFSAFTSLINQIVIPVGYDDNDAGYLGFTIIAAGMLGACIFGVLADITKRYKLLLILCGVGTLISFACFCVVMMYHKTTTMFALAMTAIAFMGLNATAVVPLVLEAAVEVTYPIPESISNGILYSVGTLFSIAVVMIMTALQQQVPSPTHPGQMEPGSMQISLWFSLGLFCAAIAILPFFKGRYLRYEKEQAMKNEIISPTIQSIDEEKPLLK
jgi:MFS family permease